MVGLRRSSFGPHHLPAFHSDSPTARSCRLPCQPFSLVKVLTFTLRSIQAGGTRSGIFSDSICAASSSSAPYFGDRGESKINDDLEKPIAVDLHNLKVSSGPVVVGGEKKAARRLSKNQ